MKLTRWLIYILFAAVFVAGIWFYSLIFKYLITAVIFSYIINPWINWLERRRIPRLLGILLVYVVIGLTITWALTRILPLIIAQAQSLMDFIQTSSSEGTVSLLKVKFIQDILARVDQLDNQVPILKLHDQFVSLIDSINRGMTNIPGILIDNYQKILTAVSLIATVPLISIFLLKDNVNFRKSILELVPNRYFEIAILLLHKVDEVVGCYLRALFFEVLIVGSLSSIVLTILGVPYSLLIGFAAGFANIIPYFGPWMGGFFAVLSILIAGKPPVMAIYAALGMYLVQVVDNNVVYPLVIGTSIKMHPLIVLLTVLAGGWAFGLIGMLVSVPLVYLIYSLVKVLYTNLKEFKMI